MPEGVSSFVEVDESLIPLLNVREEKKSYTGFKENNSAECYERFASDVLASIFIHGTTFVKTNEVVRLYNIFGSENLLRLIQDGGVKFVDDNGLHSAIIADKDDIYHHYCCTGIALDNGKALNFNSSFEKLQFGLDRSEKKIENKVSILLNVDKNSIHIPQAIYTDKIVNEISLDLRNKNVTESLGLSSSSLNEIKTEDSNRIFRLIYGNHGLVYSSFLGSQSLIAESGVSNIIANKFSGIVKPQISNSVESFSDLSKRIGIPDFFQLYKAKVIDLEFILKLRNNYGGKKFREWISSKDFDKEQISADLLRFSGIKQNTWVKYFRWAFSNAIGVIEPFTGFAASTIDSFLVDKILNGWHPSIYLNEQLREQFDRKISDNERLLKEKRVSEILKGQSIGRNDLCPCGSGKKFKKCCGS